MSSLLVYTRKNKNKNKTFKVKITFIKLKTNLIALLTSYLNVPDLQVASSINSNDIRKCMFEPLNINHNIMNNVHQSSRPILHLLR